MRVTFEDVYRLPAVRTYIERADDSLRAIGYTEHSFAHVNKVANLAHEILLKLGYSEREAELARIAGYRQYDQSAGPCAKRRDFGVPHSG